MKIIPEGLRGNSHYLIILLIVYLFSLLLTPLGVFSPSISPDDHKGYYSILRIDPGDDTRIHAYLRSMVIDGDIDFFNERGLWNRFDLTPTGYTFDFMYAIGSALLWLPFFLAGHIIAHIYSWLGYPVSTDGFSFPYLVMTGIGSATYFFAGAVICYDLLNNFFSKSVALVTAIAVCLGTHLPFYAFIRSRMAHANEFFIICLLLSLWFYIRKEHHHLTLYFLFGAVAGLACIVRMDDLPILSFVAVDFIVLFYRKYKLREMVTIKKMVKGVAAFTPAFSLIVLLPFICAHIIWGEYFALGGLSTGGDDVSTPLRFAVHILERSQCGNLWNFFFSEDKGLFLSSPFWLLALAGLWFFWKREKYWGSIILVGLSFPLIWNIIHTSTGLEYGIRRTTSALPFLCFGFAAFFDYSGISRLRIKKWLLFAVASLIIMWQYFQLIQHKILMPYNHPTFITTALKNVPHILSETPSLLLRSSSWMKLIILKDIQLQNVNDLFFMVGFPVLQLLALVCALFIFAGIKRSKRNHDGGFTPLFRTVSAAAGLFFIFLPVFLIVGNPEKSAAEISERKSFVKEISAIEKQIGRSVIYREENHLLRLVARSNLDQNQLDKAEYYAKKAIAINPHVYQTKFLLGIVYQRAGKSGEAVEMYQETLKLNPDHATTYKNLGILYLQEIKDYGKALSSFRQSLILDPDQEQAREMESTIGQLTVKVEGKQ